MITKILIDTLLKPEHFLTATSQAGPYIGQPIPGMNNTGAIRPVTSGNENGQISNLSYTTGAATANGTQTTLIDSTLRVFGTDMLTGATVTLTSGASSGEAREVTAFASETGTLTWSSDVAATSSGDSYTLTFDYTTASFELKLQAGGDTGDANFIWSRDGGSTYFGREYPVTANWQAGTTITSDFFAYYYGTFGPTPTYSYPLGMPIVQANNGDLLAAYCREASSQLLIEVSKDNGLSWTTVNTGFGNSTRFFSDAKVLKSGRILCVGGNIGIDFIGTAAGYTVDLYSDDNGATWKRRNTYGSSYRPTIHRFTQLNSGNLMGIDWNFQQDVYVRTSTNDGAFWGDATIAYSSSSNAYAHDIIQANDGNIICVYYTDELGAGTTYSIRSVISYDNGSTWSGASTIASGDNNLILPTLTKDIGGDIYCAFSEQVASAGSSIVFMVSQDNGISWGASKLLASNGSNTLHYPFLGMINGHELVCSYIDDIVGTTAAVFVRMGRSMNQTHSGVSSIICAPELAKHSLINDVYLQWYGGNGTATDVWTFSPEHQFAAKNIISNAPKKVWRSVADGVTCELVIDMGVNTRFYADSVALFDCNFNSCSVEMHTSQDWISDTVFGALVDFTETTGTISAVHASYLREKTVAGLYPDHELENENNYLSLTSGVSSGSVFRLADNVSGYLAIDTTEAHGIAISDTFNLYTNKKYQEFTYNAPRRYMRVYIPSQNTAEGYYQIGTVIVGRTTTFTNTFADSGYSRDSDYNIDIIRSLSGSMLPVVNNNRRQKWSVSWTASKQSRKEMQAIATYAKGSNMAFIPDWFVPSGGSKSSTTDVYLVKQVGTVNESFRHKDRWDLSVDFEETI